MLKRCLRRFNVTNASTPAAGSRPLLPSGRRLLRVSGPDAAPFLQGLVTQDLRRLSGVSPSWVAAVTAEAAAGSNAAGTSVAQLLDAQRPLVYGAFLNSKGRVMCDAFLFCAPSSSTTTKSTTAEAANTEMEASPAIYIEVDAADADTLCEHLGDYKLLSKVSIEALDADAATSFVSMEHNASTRGLDDEMGLVSFADPRGQAVTAYGGAIVGVAELGPAFVRAEQPPPPLHPLRRHYRLLPTSAAAAAASSSSSSSTNATSPSVVASPPVAVPASTQASASAARADTSYTRFLFERGVAEGRGLYDEDRPIVAPKGATGAAGRVFYGTQLPFEGNLDQLGAIAFDKGCYIGQELVHRTRTQLVVRRRVVPIMVSPTTTTAETIMPTAVTTTVAEENAPLSSSGSGLVLVLPRGTYLYATADAALKGDFAHAVGRVLKCVPGHADAPSPATADAAAGVAILKLDTLNPAALEASLFAVVGVRNGSHVANGGGAAAAGVTSGTAPTDEAAAAHLVPVRAYVPTWWADSVIDSSLAITDAPGVDETA